MAKLNQNKLPEETKMLPFKNHEDLLKYVKDENVEFIDIRFTDIMGMMHPPIPEPDTKIYETSYKHVAGTNVLFRHKEHIHRFGFSCAECHHEDSCARCHENGRTGRHTQRFALGI